MAQKGVLRVAMVGCGVIARQHLIGYQCSGRARVTAVVDIRRDKAETFAREAGSAETTPKVFTDLKEALAWGEFDAIDIMTPHDLHHDHAMMCMNAGKHVLLEKPMAISLSQCQALIAEGQRRQGDGQVFMVAENAQYWPEVVKVKELIDSGRIGEVYLAKANYWESTVTTPFEKRTSEEEHWEFKPERVGGGLLMSGSCHWLRPLRFWLGEVEEVIGVTATPFMINPGFETLSHAMLRFRSGVTATFQALLADSALSNSPFFQVFGTEGEIVVGGGFKGGVTVYDKDHVDGESLGAAKGYFESFPPTIAVFVSATLDKRPVDADAEYCSGEPRIAWAIYRSLKSKRWESVWDN